MDDLLIKYLLGEATKEEGAQVERWLEENPVNRQRFEQYKTLWAVSRRTADQASARSGRGDIGRKGQGFAPAPGRVLASGRGRTGPGQERKSGGYSIGRLRLAAVMIGILLLAAGGYSLLVTRRPVAAPASEAGTVGRGSLETQPTVRSLAMPEEEKGSGRKKKFWRGDTLVASGRPRTDTLADGSVVTLNRGASLVVGRRTGEELSMRLQGEGFFSVVRDPSRSFKVGIDDVTITVLGTSFEVLGVSSDSMEIVVETGDVGVGRRGEGKGILVHAGERLCMTASGGWKKERYRDMLYGYYLGRPLVCDSTPLRRLVEVLNRTDDTHIVLGRKTLGDLPLTTVFRRETPERILDVVALTFNLSVVRRGSAIILQ